MANHHPGYESPLLATSWSDLTFVAFDTETTGKYPLSAEICELAGVKWRGGQVVETFQTLIKPSRPMGQEVINIHGITNEMVEDAPRIDEKIAEFHRFIEGAVTVAHHAPFDLGFLSIEFENAGLALPAAPVLCSSLLSRRLFPESENHRLQTLIKFFQLEQGAAHRALDDARACLEVALRCLERAGSSMALSGVCAYQGGPITWRRFSMRELIEDSRFATLRRAVLEQKVVEMVYGGDGSKVRRVHPEGIVRSLDGDFLVAYDVEAQKSKRFFLVKITSAQIVS